MGLDLEGRKSEPSFVRHEVPLVLGDSGSWSWVITLACRDFFLLFTPRGAILGQHMCAYPLSLFPLPFQALACTGSCGFGGEGGVL